MKLPFLINERTPSSAHLDVPDQLQSNLVFDGDEEPRRDCAPCAVDQPCIREPDLPAEERIAACRIGSGGTCYAPGRERAELLHLGGGLARAAC